MANLSKERRDRMMAKLEELKVLHSDDESIMALNEIENALKEKKFGLVFEEHTEAVDEMLRENIPVFTADPERRLCKDESLPWNFIIEGDNLQALYLLEKTHRGKVDCIYIDPPYNTGARDWKYNNDYVVAEDAYRHSKWLSMMQNRLAIAKNLLSKDGFLITTIDDNELANLYLLIESIFPEYHNTIITVQMNPGGTQSAGFSVTNEYAIVTYLKDSAKISRKFHIGEDPYNLRRWGSTSNRYEGATCFYPVIIGGDGDIMGFGDVLPDVQHPAAQVEPQPDGTMWVWPIDKSNVEKKWRYGRDTVESVLERMFYERDGDRIEVKLNRETKPFKTVWVNDEYNSESHGTKLIKAIIGKDKFSYPKSLYATKDCLFFALAEKRDAVVLDFFAGSGTTMHAVNLLNAEDGGSRRCIIVTNNEVSEKETKELDQKGIVRGSAEWESYGIARSATWPRISNSINGIDFLGEPLAGCYQTSKVEKTEKKRTYLHINYIETPATLSTAQKKRILATVCKGLLPQNLVTGESKYVVSDDPKHTATVLFDDSAATEWLKRLRGKDYLDTVVIITNKTATFNNLKSSIEAELDPIIVNTPVLLPMSDGFAANVKYLKCDWVARHPDEGNLTELLFSHIAEMVELENHIEVDGKTFAIVLNEEQADLMEQKWAEYQDLKGIYLSRNVLLTTTQNALFYTRQVSIIPDYYFNVEMREVGESW